jgi:hypothetical protein
VSSIEAVAAQLRRGLALLSAELVEQAALLWDEAHADLSIAAWGSQSYELPEAIRMVEHGLEMLREAHQVAANARAAAERYLAHLMGDGAAGGGAVLVGGGGTPAQSVNSLTPGSTGEVDATNAPVAAQTVRRQVDPELVAEAQRQGLKISAERVMRIGRDQARRIVWLEDGDENAGMRHLMEAKRVRQFGGVGVAEADIVDLVFLAATRGKPIGVSGRDRIVFEIDFRGTTQRLAVTVGDNGFIVGAHPIPVDRKLKPLS